MNKEDFNKLSENSQKEKLEKNVEKYNEYIIELSQNPKNWGIPSKDEFSVSQSYTGPCGDTVKIFLKINAKKIEKAQFISDGCRACIASASQTTILIEGHTLDYAKTLKPEDINKALKGLPEDHKHCTELAVRTLRRTIDKYESQQVN